MNSTKYINAFFSFSLLLVFVVCAFLLLMMQINGYRQINDQNVFYHQHHTPVAYISNKVKSANSIDIVDNMLVLNIDSVQTYIYEDHGTLKEGTVLSGYEFDRSLGDTLFSCDSFQVSKKDTIVYVEMEMDGIKKEFQFMDRKGEFE